MSSDTESATSDHSNSDHDTLPSFNLVATPSVGEVAESEHEEEVSEVEEPQPKKKKTKFAQLQAEIYEVRELLQNASKRHRSQELDQYKPSSFKVMAKYKDGDFTTFSNEFLDTLPDELEDIFTEVEKRPRADPSMDALTNAVLQENFRRRNARAYYCLAVTLHESGKLNMISMCPKKDGVGTWRYLKSIGLASNWMAASAAISRIIVNSRTCADDVNDLMQKNAVESTFAEAARMKMMTPELEKAWKPMIYVHSLPPALDLVKQRVLLDPTMTPRSIDEIYAMVVAQRAYSAQGKEPEAMAAKATAPWSKSTKYQGKQASKTWIPYEKPTEEERVGTCTVCGKLGHGARTCRKRIRSGTGNKSDNGKSNKSEQASAAYFDEEVDAFHGELGEYGRLHGKAYSSDNTGDGPTSAEIELMRKKIIATRGQIEDFLKERISDRCVEPRVDLIETLVAWGWTNPVTDLRSLKGHYNQVESSLERRQILHWIDSMEVEGCRPFKFEAKEAEIHPGHINGFDYARRGFITGAQPHWNDEEAASEMFRPGLRTMDQLSESIMFPANGTIDRARDSLSFVDREFRNHLVSPEYLEQSYDDRTWERESYLELVHAGMEQVAMTEHVLTNLENLMSWNGHSRVDILTLRAMDAYLDGQSENRAVVKLLLSKLKRRRTDSPLLDDDIRSVDETTESMLNPLPITSQVGMHPDEFESASSTAAYRDPRFHPQPYREEEETTASTAVFYNTRSRTRGGGDAILTPEVQEPGSSTVVHHNPQRRSREENSVEPPRTRARAENNVVPTPEVLEPSSSTVVHHTPRRRSRTGDNVEPPRKFGKGYSSDVTGDGPSTFSKGTNQVMGVGHRPQVVKFLIDSGCSHHMVDSSKVTLFNARATRVKINGIDPTRPMIGDQVGRFGPLGKVLGVPGLSKNLISVGAACAAGYKFLFSSEGAVLYANNDVLFSEPILKGKLINNIFYLELTELPNTIDTELFIPQQQISMPASIVPLNRAALWHARFGHISHKTLRHLIDTDMVDGIGDKPTKNMWNELEQIRCEACVKGKMTMAPVSRKSGNIEEIPRSRAVDVVTTTVKAVECKYKKGQMICIDLLTSSVESLGKAKYALTILDVGSHYMWTYFLKSKEADEVREALRCWLLDVKKDGIAPEAFMTIRSDNGNEFIETKTSEFLRENGINHDRAPPHYHVHAIERLNRTLQEMTRSMLVHAKLPAKYWAEALNAATYTLNRLPCKPFQKDRTRYEAYFGIKPDVSHMRTFGAYCWVRNYDIDLRIWDDRAERRRFLGYPKDSTLSWRVGNLRTDVVTHSANVIFDEAERYLGEGLSNDTDLEGMFEDNPGLEAMLNDGGDHLLEMPEQPKELHQSPEEIEAETYRNKRQKLDEAIIVTRSGTALLPTDILIDDGVVPGSSAAGEEVATSLLAGKVVNPLKRKRTSAADKLRQFQLDRDEVTTSFAYIALQKKVNLVHDIITPLTLREALEGPDAAEWSNSMLDESCSLKDNNTFEVIVKPVGARVLGHKWVYKVKANQDGIVTRYKSRYTALGNRQREDIDYDETFAPVVRNSSLKTLFAVAAANDFPVHQMDVDTAFLYGNMPPEPALYMEVPAGYPIPDHLLGRTDLVGLVKKGIYGLKQSPRLWNETVNEFMIGRGFSRFTTDQCVYKRGQAETQLFVAIYVDDLIITGASLDIIDTFKSELKDRFKMKDLGPIKYCLGMEITQDLVKGTIEVKQQGYVRSILRRFGLLEAKTSPIPMDPGLELTKDKLTFDVTANFDYPAAIGSLLYLTSCTRPDIAYAVHRLSRFLNSHGPTHHLAAKRIMRYLLGNDNVGLIYRRRVEMWLNGYSDADWASDKLTRRSVSGYIFNLGDSPISWNSKLQSTVANSSTEAEYLAMGAASKEALYLERLLTEFGVCIEYHKISTKDLVDLDTGCSLRLFGDNMGAIAMTESAKLNHKTTKWIDIREHGIRDLVDSGALIVSYLNTEEMPADTMTKALAFGPFIKHRDFMMTSARA